MGSALAARLLEAGQAVAIWNRTPAKTTALAGLGATVHRTLGGVTASEVVFICVTSSEDLLDILRPNGEVLAPTGNILAIVDCSTVSPGASAEARQRCRDAGIEFLAAPVSGNPNIVAGGRAAMAVSGPNATFERTRHLLEALAGRVIYTGQEEQARLVKLGQNLYLGMLIEALVEVLALTESAGVKRSDFLEYLNSTVVGSEWVVDRMASIVERDWTPTFTFRLLDKDFSLGLAEAERLHVSMDIAAHVRGLIQDAIRKDLGDIDMLGGLYERVLRS